MQELGCQKPCWDQARLSSLVNKQVESRGPSKSVRHKWTNEHLLSNLGLLIWLRALKNVRIGTDTAVVTLVRPFQKMLVIIM